METNDTILGRTLSDMRTTECKAYVKQVALKDPGFIEHAERVRYAREAENNRERDLFPFQSF